MTAPASAREGEYTWEPLPGLTYLARTGSNDYSVVHACVLDDEYDLEDVDVRDRLVFDVGAHVGGVGIWLASRGARVVCVEPVPTNADLIRRSAALSDVDIVVLEAAAGAAGTQVVRWGFTADPGWNERVAEDPALGDLHTDQRRVSIEHHGWIGDTRPTAPVDQNFHELTVRSFTLSELVPIYGVPDVLKLDCEGGEWAWFADPAIQDVGLIVGEWHPWDIAGTRGPDGQPETWTQDSVRDFLGRTHRLTFGEPAGGPANFTARRRS